MVGVEGRDWKGKREEKGTVYMPWVGGRIGGEKGREREEGRER